MEKIFHESLYRPSKEKQHWCSVSIHAKLYRYVLCFYTCQVIQIQQCAVQGSWSNHNVDTTAKDLPMITNHLSMHCRVLSEKELLYFYNPDTKCECTYYYPGVIFHERLAIQIIKCQMFLLPKGFNWREEKTKNKTITSSKSWTKSHT